MFICLVCRVRVGVSSPGDTISSRSKTQTVGKLTRSLVSCPNRHKIKKRSAAIVIAGCWTTGGLTENKWETLEWHWTVSSLITNFPVAELFVLMEANKYLNVKNCNLLFLIYIYISIRLKLKLVEKSSHSSWRSSQVWCSHRLQCNSSMVFLN